MHACLHDVTLLHDAWDIPRVFPTQSHKNIAKVVASLAACTIKMDTQSVNNFLKLLKEICTSSGGLLGPVIQTLNEVRSFARQMDEAGRDLAAGVNPEVAMAIEDLKVLFHAVGGKVRLYVFACKDMAFYVCESGVMEDIKKDLEERKSIEELKYFLESMRDYLRGCRSSLEQFNTIHSTFSSDLKRNSDQWEEEAKKGMAEEKTNLYVSRGAGIAAVTMGIGCVTLIAATAAASTVCPPIALALAAPTAAVLLTGTAVSGGLAGKFAVEKGISEERKKVFVEAAKRASEFYAQLAAVEIKIGAMETNLEVVITYLGGAGANGEQNSARSGLTELAARASSGGRLDTRRITSDLKLLREHMEKTLSEAREYLE